MSTVATTYAHIVCTPGVCGGKPRIDGHRIRVQDIAAEHVFQGLSVDDICAQHPSLTPSQVHSALAYFYDHRDAILQQIEADKQFAEAFRQDHPEWVR